MMLDDISIMDFADEIESVLSIHLPKPLICHTLGELVGIVARRQPAGAKS
jgi:hypothetical protein